MYGELKCFIKPFTKLETSSNFLNSDLKILQKIQFFEFQSIKSSFWSIKCFFWSIEQESKAIESSKVLKIIFSIISIDQAKVLTDWKSLFSNFTQKILELEFSLYETIFSKFKHHYYNLTMYIPIYTTNSLFLYNSIIVTHITTFPIILFLFQINKENLYFI